MQKETTTVTNANGGIHDQKAFRRIKAMLLENTYKRPRLYHLVLTDNSGVDVHDFQAALKALVLKLKTRGIPCKWRACLELDDDEMIASKGLHFHVFILVNDIGRGEKSSPCDWINNDTSADGWLYAMTFQRGMGFQVAAPKAAIHKTAKGKVVPYATLGRNKRKLDDCINWISYLVKARSKPEGVRSIYFSSRDKKPAIQALNEG